MADKRWFNLVRWIAIAAIVCTFAAIVLMLVESGLSGEKSLATSNKFTNGNGGDVVVDIEGKDVPTKRLTADVVQGFRGDSKKAAVHIFPEESTDRELVYSVSSINTEDPNGALAVAVDPDGTLHFNNFGNCTLSIALKSDPTIKTSTTVTCFGTRPSEITSLSFSQSSFTIGKEKNVYMIDQNGKRVSIVPYAKTYDNACVGFDISTIIPKKVGDATVTFSHKNLKDGVNATFTLTVLDDPAFVPLQELVSNVKVDEDGYYHININKQVDISNFCRPQPANATCAAFFTYNVKNIDSGTLSHVGGYWQRATKEGTAEVTLTSMINPEKSITIKVKVDLPKPNAIHIEAENVAIVDTLCSIKVYSDDAYINKNDISFEVIRGKAAFENGGFRSKRLGKLIIKATYLPDPTITAQIEINTLLFKTFGQFIRKILGHLSLFAVIGFGLSYVFMLGLRRRWASVPISAAAGFLLAVCSEAIQSVTPGRYASWTDVSVDTFGAIMGVIVAWALIALVLLVARIFKKSDKLWASIKSLTFANMFRRYVPVLLEYSACPRPADPPAECDDKATTKCLDAEDYANAQDLCAADAPEKDDTHKS